MLILLSPAKRLDDKMALATDVYTQCELLDHTSELATELKKMDAEEVGALMKLSDKLANLNYDRYQKFNVPFTPDNARPTLYTFKGDVYDKMDVENYTEEDLLFAQDHLRMLSGFYGLLRPLDLMQPYRLEMGTKLANKRGKNLYEFWGNAITDEINKVGDDVVLNLASQEYFGAVKPEALKGKLLTVHFKQHKNGAIKTIGMMAKRARGMMTDYIIKNRITDVEQLKNFKEGGYTFQKDPSTDSDWYFFMDMDH